MDSSEGKHFTLVSKIIQCLAFRREAIINYESIIFKQFLIVAKKVVFLGLNYINTLQS